MPDGKTHEHANLALVPASALLVATAFPPEQALAYLAGGLFGTFWVTPDLDLSAHNAEVRPLRYWGPLKVIWVPYGIVFRHRGLSHTWIVGPLSRLLYLALAAALLLNLLGASGFQLPLDPVRPYLPAFAAGYFVAQWVHLVLDAIPGLGRRWMP